ncbi:MAG TPA: mechanosensitive ion channel protein MscS, partial [Pseudomonas sp.]|nr:mechanosensitive ion channel protein MscS [Pseudomonas sp.]
MDIQRFWRDSLDRWGTLDQHPMLHAAIGLAVLLVISLILGRLARFLV